MKLPEHDLIHERGQALENAFFAERDRQLLDVLRRRLALETVEHELTEATGVTDEIAIPELAGLPAPHFLALLGIFPMVEIAWCDRHISSKERALISTAAAEMGVTAGSATQALLNRWLENRPPENAAQLWTEYVQAVCATLTPETVKKLKQSVMGRAKKTAQATGGMLGVGEKISAAEKSCLERLAKAFPSPNQTS